MWFILKERPGTSGGRISQRETEKSKSVIE